MTRTTTICMLAIAFVAGTIMTGSIAYAVQGDNNGQPFLEIQASLATLQAQVDSFFDIFTELQSDVEVLKTQTEDINIGIGELQETDESLQDQINNIQTSQSGLHVYVIKKTEIFPVAQNVNTVYMTCESGDIAIDGGAYFNSEGVHFSKRNLRDWSIRGLVPTVDGIEASTGQTPNGYAIVMEGPDLSIFDKPVTTAFVTCIDASP